METRDLTTVAYSTCTVAVGGGEGCEEEVADLFVGLTGIRILRGTNLTKQGSQAETVLLCHVDVVPSTMGLNVKGPRLDSGWGVWFGNGWEVCF